MSPQEWKAEALRLADRMARSGLEGDIAKTREQLEQHLEALAARAEKADDYVKLLAECRDAFDMPEPGAGMDAAWCSAMAYPDCVPDYVRQSVQALKANRPAAQVPAVQEERVSVPEKLLRKLVEWRHCMSYNDSYFGEPAGLLKGITAELERLLPPTVLAAAPAEAPSEDGLRPQEPTQAEWNAFFDRHVKAQEGGAA